MKLNISAAIILTILMTGCASHKGKRPSSGEESITSILPGGALLIGFNLNDDYEIDSSEFNSGRVRAFKKADLNDNGVIDLAEFRFWQPKANGSQSALPNLVHFDTNFNDEITLSEFDAGLLKLFESADENKDGKVSYEELVTIKSPPEARKRNNSSGRGSGERKQRRRGNPSNF